jgi:hypothetical protein
MSARRTDAMLSADTSMEVDVLGRAHEAGLDHRHAAPATA